MKRSVDQWPVRMSDHVAFFSYRWLAWAVAALALTLPARPLSDLPRDAGLLLLIGVINVVATALAQGYVRVARQRPAILLLDLVASAAVLWLSGSRALPFLPYALGALVLPALLFRWRGALLGSVTFVALDLLGLALISPDVGAALGALTFGARVLTPFGFSGAWVVLDRVLPRVAAASSDRARLEARGPDMIDAAREPPLGRSQPIRMTERSRPEPPTSAPSNLVAPGPVVLTRAVPEQRLDLPRRSLYDLTATRDATLISILEQLGSTTARQSSLEVRVSCTGSPKALTQAQHSLILRAAQEALLNVQQHARAHLAVITLSYEHAAVTLEVHDDGVGLLDGTYERPGLHSLRAVRYRLAELDGQLAVFEGEDGGVTFRATLPLE